MQKAWAPFPDSCIQQHIRPEIMDAYSVYDLFCEYLWIGVREQPQQIPAAVEKLKDQWGQLVPPGS